MSSKSKTKSDVWGFFTKKDSDSCICNLCGKNYKTGGGTTNLKNHLVHKHPLCESRNKNKPISTDDLTIPAKKSKKSTMEVEEENETNSVDLDDLFEIVRKYIASYLLILIYLKAY